MLFCYYNLGLLRGMTQPHHKFFPLAPTSVHVTSHASFMVAAAQVAPNSTQEGGQSYSSSMCSHLVIFAHKFSALVITEHAASATNFLGHALAIHAEILDIQSIPLSPWHPRASSYCHSGSPLGPGCHSPTKGVSHWHSLPNHSGPPQFHWRSIPTIINISIQLSIPVMLTHPQLLRVKIKQLLESSSSYTLFLSLHIHTPFDLGKHCNSCTSYSIYITSISAHAFSSISSKLIARFQEGGMLPYG